MRTAICMPKRNFKSQDDAEVFFAKGRHDIPWYFPHCFVLLGLIGAQWDWIVKRCRESTSPWILPSHETWIRSSKVRKFRLIRFMIRCGSWRVLRRLCHEISKWRGLKQWKQSDVLRCSTFTAELTTWIGKGFPRFPDGCPNRRELYYRYTVVSLSRSLSVSPYPENDARAAAHVETQGRFTCEGWRRRRFRSAFPKSWFPWPVAFAPLPRWSQPPESKIWGRQRWNNEMWQNLLRLEWWNENIHQGVTRLQGAARSICINA